MTSEFTERKSKYCTKDTVMTEEVSYSCENKEHKLAESKYTVFNNIYTLDAGWKKMMVVGNDLHLIYEKVIKTYTAIFGSLISRPESEIENSDVNILYNNDILSAKDAKRILGTDKVRLVTNCRNGSIVYVSGGKNIIHAYIYEHKKFSEKKAIYDVPDACEFENLNDGNILVTGQGQYWVGNFETKFVKVPLKTSAKSPSIYVSDKFIFGFIENTLTIFDKFGEKLLEILSCCEPAFINPETMIYRTKSGTMSIDLQSFKTKIITSDIFISVDWCPVWLYAKFSAYADELVGRKYHVGKTIIHKHFAYA